MSWWEVGVLAKRIKKDFEKKMIIQSHLSAVIANTFSKKQNGEGWVPSDFFDPEGEAKPEDTRTNEEVLKKFPKTIPINGK